MSDASQGPGWWQAADGRWYPPDQPPAPGWWRASDGNWYPPADDGAPASTSEPAPPPATEPTPVAGATDASATPPPTSPPDATTPAPEATPTTAPGTEPAVAAAGPASAPPTSPPAAAPPGTDPGQPQPVPAAGSGTGSKGRGKGPLIAVGILVVLVLIAGVAFVATRGGDEPTEVATDNPTTSATTGDDGEGGDEGTDTTEGGGDGGDEQKAEISDEMPSDDITLTEDVVVVNSEQGAMFKGFSADGTAMLLDPAAENADQLEAGKILLLSGITVVRVASVEDTEEGLVVTGEPVTLPEVIADGELEWNDVGLDPETARLRVYGDEAIGGSGDGTGGGSSGGSDDGEITEEEILEEGGGGIVDGLGGNGMRSAASAWSPRTASKTVSGTIDEFSFDISYEPTGGSGHHIKLVLTGTGDLAGTMTIDVNVASVASSGTAVVNGRQVKQFDLTYSDFGGDATITTDLQSTKQLTSVMTPPFLKVPFGIEFPALVGGIPFTLSISGTIQVQLSFALAGATLSGEAQISFGGDAGFHFKDGSVTLAGQRVQDAPDLLSKLAGGGSGPVGVVLTAELPKVGFGFGFLQTGAGVYISSGMVSSQTILPPPPACHSMQVAYVLAAGVEAKFLGKDFDIARKAIVDKRWDYTVPQTAQCTQ